MTVVGTSVRKVGIAVGAAMILSAGALIPSARAQFACGPGFFWQPGFGCVPVTYGAWPYAFPDPGFGFFYGPRWGGRWGWAGGRGFRGGPAFRGGRGFRGGGFRGGGRGRGRGGGRRR